MFTESAQGGSGRSGAQSDPIELASMVKKMESYSKRCESFFVDPIQLVWMVKEIGASLVDFNQNLIHHPFQAGWGLLLLPAEPC